MLSLQGDLLLYNALLTQIYTTLFNHRVSALLAAAVQFSSSNKVWHMGRTIPSFRIASMIEETEWKVFRKSLNKSDRKVFDSMFAIAHLYNSACSYTANPVRINPIFMSIIFHHYKQLTMIAKQIERIQKDHHEPF